MSPSPASWTGIRHIRIQNPWFLEQDSSGRPAAGYYVYTLEAGSVDTLINTFSNRELTSLNTNPIVLNERGEANIFVGVSSVKLVFTAPGADLTSPIWVQDYVTESVADINGVGAAYGTTNNIYHVDTSPPFASIPDGFSLVMIPDTASLDTLITRTFTGTGINDPVFSGPYIGSTSSIFSVEIDATPGGVSPDTFRWRKDAGAWTSGVVITANIQTLGEGFAVTFSELQGHVIGDLWTYSVRPPAYLDFCGLGPSIIYKSVDGTLVALSANDIASGIPAHMDWSASQSSWILLNPSLPSLSSLARKIARKVISGNYSLLLSDTGNEVCYTGTGGHTLTLLACVNAASYVFDFVNAGTGDWFITVAGGTDKIAYPGVVGGVNTIVLNKNGRSSVRLVTNGADWNILADVQAHGTAVLSGTGTFRAPLTGNLFVSGCAGGGGGVTAANGGAAGGARSRFRIPVTVGDSLAFSVGAGGAANSPGTDTAFGTVTLTGGVQGAGAGLDGDDALYGYGFGGIQISSTPPTGSGAGGYGGANPGAGADGFLIIEW